MSLLSPESIGRLTRSAVDMKVNTMMTTRSAKGPWVMASLLIVMCIGGVAVDCTGSDAEGRLREARKLCSPAAVHRCLHLALRLGRLDQADHHPLRNRGYQARRCTKPIAGGQTLDDWFLP
jgi:hypothetical protein